MPFTGRNPEKLEILDLQSLVENKVQESKHLDYKLTYGWTDKEKRELLADISAFANTAGGYLIIGVKEEEGHPVGIPGVKVTNPDSEKLKIINLLRDGIEPRLPAVSLKMVPVAEETYTIVIAVHKSWIGPHVVTFDKLWRIFRRTSGGKEALDVDEMRQAFLMSDALADKIRTYHAHRVGLLASNESCCQLKAGPQIFINLIPFTALSAGTAIDLGTIKRENSLLPILGSTYAGTSRYNIDGILSVIDYQMVEAYCQLFRNGITESAHVDTIYGQNSIAGDYHEQHIIHFIRRMFELYRLLEVPPPFAVFLSLIGVKGHYLRYDQGFSGYTSGIDRDIVNLPEIVLQDYDADIEKAMKPAYDALWNAGGWEKSPNYDAEGNRIRRR